MRQLSPKDLQTLSLTARNMHSRCLTLLWQKVTIRTYGRHAWTNLRPNVLKPLQRLQQIVENRSEVARAVHEVVVEDEEPSRLLNYLHHLPELPATSSLTRREYVRHTTEILRQIVRLVPNLRRFRKASTSFSLYIEKILTSPPGGKVIPWIMRADCSRSCNLSTLCRLSRLAG